MASNGATCRRRTPDHPPYALMIGTAIKSLAEEGGSTEESISRFIRSNYTNIPPGHDLLLPYYLDRLTARAEFLVSVPGRYLVPPHLQEEDPQPPQPEEEEKKRSDLQEEGKTNGDPTEEQKEGEGSVSIEEGLPLVCKGDLVVELQALASSPGTKPVVPMRKRGRPATKKKMSPGTMGLPESVGGLLVSATASLPVAVERDTLEPGGGPRKRGRKPKKINMMSTESVGLAESGGCGLSVSIFASKSMATEHNNLQPNNEADEPDNRARKRGRPPKKNDTSGLTESGICGLSVSTFVSKSVAPEHNKLEPNNEGDDEPDNRPRKRVRPPKKNDTSCLTESGSCGLSVSTFTSDSLALERNSLELNNVGDKPDNSPRKRGRPLKKKKNMTPETIVPGVSGGRGLSVLLLPSLPVALELDNVEHKKELNKPDTVPKRLGRPPKSKPMLAADETPTSKCEPESVWATAEKSTGKCRGRPPNSGEKTDNGEPESEGATMEKKTGKRLGRPPKDSGKKKDNKRLGRPPKDSGKKKDKGEPESAGTNVEKSTAKHCGRPLNSGEETDNGEAKSTGATNEKKTDKCLGRPPKNSGKKKDKGEPESTGTTEEKSTAKHRGRPPKTKTDNGELVLATSKRFGRPPKNSGKKTVEEKTGKLRGRPQKQKPDAMGFLI